MSCRTVNVGPETCANASDERTAIRGTIGLFDSRSRQVECVGHQLSPKWTACTAARKSNAINTRASLTNKREHFTKRACDTFKDCSRQMRMRRSSRHSYESPPCIWIGVRSSLARKIGKEECAFAAKWRRLRLIQHQFVWINSECSRGCNKILAHCIAPPTQTSACGKSDAHQVPTIWNRMTKRMENSMGSWPPLVCCGKDHTTRSHCASDRSLCDDSRSNSLRCLIACACNNNCSQWKSRCCGAIGVHTRTWCC